MKPVGGWMNPSPVLVFWAKSAWWGPEPSVRARWQLGERVPGQASAALALVLWPQPLPLGAWHQHFWPADWSWSTCNIQFVWATSFCPHLIWSVNNFRCVPSFSKSSFKNCFFSVKFYWADHFQSQRRAAAQAEHPSPVYSPKLNSAVWILSGNVFYSWKWWIKSCINQKDASCWDWAIDLVRVSSNINYGISILPVLLFWKWV